MNKKLLIIVPAYNEEESIVSTIENLTAVCPEYDYLIINDGSKDNTSRIAHEHHYNIIDQPVNLGLAGTFQTGARFALENGYEAIMQFDADGQHNPEYIKDMYEKLCEGYDIVIGSRFVKVKKPRSLRMLGSNIISTDIRMLTKLKINDPTSGMRIYSKRLIPILAHNHNITPEPDSIAYLILNGAKVTEVQVQMNERRAGKSYLTFTKSISYMVTICTSDLIISWFRPKLKLEEYK